jgi:hypothetical protein
MKQVVCSQCNKTEVEPFLDIDRKSGDLFEVTPVCRACDKNIKNNQLCDLLHALKSLNKHIIKTFIETNDIDEVLGDVNTYLQIKANIGLLMSYLPIIMINDTIAQDMLKALQTMTLETERLLLDYELQNIYVVNDIGYDVNLIDKNKQEHLDWLKNDLLNPYSYFNDLIEIGCLVILNTYSEHLETFMDELRHCYASRRYLAVYSLCGTILEIAVRDACTRIGLLESRNENVLYFESHPESEEGKLATLINKISKGHLREELHHLRRKIIPIIHGAKTVTQHDAKEVFQQTAWLIEKLYTQHGVDFTA